MHDHRVTISRRVRGVAECRAVGQGWVANPCCCIADRALQQGAPAPAPCLLPPTKAMGGALHVATHQQDTRHGSRHEGAISPTLAMGHDTVPYCWGGPCLLPPTRGMRDMPARTCPHLHACPPRLLAWAGCCGCGVAPDQSTPLSNIEHMIEHLSVE